eukprot:GILI01022739.1.p3 GENE.GILI01022739.1~~GILI01022739.1.p3  ORF type:complete len:169 (+),score=21.70 GILI01022739.1:1112-1618(+)
MSLGDSVSDIPSFYFGYGSNLCSEDYSEWLRLNPSVPQLPLRFLSSACVHDHRVIYAGGPTALKGRRKGGVASIEKCPGSTAYGGLYHLNDAELVALRRKEGYPSYYTEIVVDVTTPDGSVVQALTYQLLPEYHVQVLPPSDMYVDVITRGFREIGLDVSLVPQYVSL